MTLKIAESQSDYLPALREIYLQVRQATFTWFDTSHYQLTSFDTDTKDEYVLVASIDDVVVGFVSAYMPENFIHHVYVHQSYQKQGIGKMLLDAMLTKMKPPAGLKCLQLNEAAIAFYKKYGFVKRKKGISTEGIYLLLEYAGEE